MQCMIMPLHAFAPGDRHSGKERKHKIQTREHIHIVHAQYVLHNSTVLKTQQQTN